MNRICSLVVATIWFGSPCAYAQLTPIEEGGTFDAENLAAASGGATAFAIDILLVDGNPTEAHQIDHLNDEIYGNTNSWIGETGAPAFAGVDLGGSFEISSIAFGRDNGGEANQLIDRSLGTYTLQYTTVATPGVDTPENDWITIGDIVYSDFCPPSPWLRHRFNFDPVEATGVRILVPGVGLAAGSCIDEIEVYATHGAEVLDPCVAPEALELVETGGPVAFPAADDVSTLAEGNLARASDAVAFGTESHPAPVHEIPFANDGLYGNSNSWLGNTPGPDTGLAYIGVYFENDLRTVEEIALGRDNLGQFNDRAVGSYLVEYTDEDFDHTTDAGVAAANWTTLGIASAHTFDGLPSLRHRYRFPAVQVRAVRVVTAVQNAIDEIELGKIVVDRETILEPLTLLETGGPDTTPAAADDVPGVKDGNIARAADAIPFASPTDAPRSATALTDGTYGDAGSWLGSTPAGPLEQIYAGVYFGDGNRLVSAIGIGRDNTGQLNDRAAGDYIVEVAAVPFDFADAAAITAVRWEPLGVAQGHLEGADAGLRRVYDLGAVQARAIRVRTEQGNVIDEIELYEVDAGGELTLVQAGGVFDAPTNLAIREGAFPFAIDSLAGFPIHDIANLNDGVYGNDNSWIGDTGSPAFCGINLGGQFTIQSIAFGRDNLQFFVDRSLGEYRLQVTTVPDADETTPFADWTTVGTVTYDATFPPDGMPWLRHRYNFPPVEATAVRLIVPGAGIAGGTCIDEFEVYEEPGEKKKMPTDGLELLETGGPFTTPALPLDVPSADDGNLSLTSGAVAFGSPAHELEIHAIAHLKDGFYGNDNSWLGVAIGEVTGLVYAGIYFTDSTPTIGEIALGRDNTGVQNTRAAGPYVVEYTTDEFDPASDADVAAVTWTEVGKAVAHLSVLNPPGLRRRYAFPKPVTVRAVRVVTLLQNAFDEIELYAGEPTKGTPFLRGDTNSDGQINIGDPVFLLNALFGGGPLPTCRESSDMSNDGGVDISDPIFLLNFLFGGGPPPAAPGHESCGLDPDPEGSPGDLGCDLYTGCAA